MKSTHHPSYESMKLKQWDYPCCTQPSHAAHTKSSAVSSSNWQDAQTGLIKTTMPRDKRNQNSELFFRQTGEVFGCLELYVFYSKLGLSITVKCDPVFWVCVNYSLAIHIPDNWSWQWKTRLWFTEVGVGAHFRQPISLL
jgi:hypothetical protein